MGNEVLFESSMLRLERVRNLLVAVWSDVYTGSWGAESEAVRNQVAELRRAYPLGVAALSIVPPAPPHAFRTTFAAAGMMGFLHLDRGKPIEGIHLGTAQWVVRPTVAQRLYTHAIRKVIARSDAIAESCFVTSDRDAALGWLGRALARGSEPWTVGELDEVMAPSWVAARRAA